MRLELQAGQLAGPHSGLPLNAARRGQTSSGSSRERMEGSARRGPVPGGFQCCGSGDSEENGLE